MYVCFPLPLNGEHKQALFPPLQGKEQRQRAERNFLSSSWNKVCFSLFDLQLPEGLSLTALIYFHNKVID